MEVGGMRVLVTGSRNWQESDVVDMALYQLKSFKVPIVIVHGGAIGADNMAREWAKNYGYTTEAHKPEYDKYPGFLAPLKRNDAMLDSGIDLCLAFMLSTPEKGGTLYTVNGAKARRIPVIIYNWPGDVSFPS